MSKSIDTKKAHFQKLYLRNFLTEYPCHSAFPQTTKLSIHPAKPQKKFLNCIMTAPGAAEAHAPECGFPPNIIVTASLFAE